MLTAGPMSVSAQEFFREYGTSRSSGGIGPVTASDYTYQDVSPTGLAPIDPAAQGPATPGGPTDIQEENHNFAIGPIRFAMALGFGVEFNDNITYSQYHRESDIVLRPTLNVDAMWHMSSMNTLRFSIGASYAKYLNHSQYDTNGVLLSPNSELEFTFGLGESVKVSLRERFSYQEDPYDIPTLSSVAKYGRYENQAGVEVEWNASEKLRVNVGYDHYNLWTTENAFSDQDRAIDTFFLKPSYAMTSTLRTGLNFSYSHISFDSSDRSDGQSILVGPFIKWQITEATNAFLEGGFQSLTFDGSYQPSNIIDQFVKDNNLTKAQAAAVRSTGGDTDQDDNTFYVRFEIDNKPNEVLQHRLSGSKTAEVGFFTNYFDLYHVEYSLDWKALSKTEISPTIFYEYLETSGTDGEKASRVGAAVGIRHYLTNSITLGLDYRFLYKDSNIDGFDYYQNLGFVSVYYKF